MKNQKKQLKTLRISSFMSSTKSKPSDELKKQRLRFEALKRIASSAPLDQIKWKGHYDNVHFEYHAFNIGCVAWSPDTLSVWNGQERIFVYEGQEVKPVYKSTERRFNRRRVAEDKRAYQAVSRAESRKMREFDVALRIR